MPRRSYTDEQRAEAVALYATHGPTHVADTLGIPKGTVGRWAEDAGVGTVRNEQTAAATEARKLDREAARLDLADDMSEAAVEALAACRAAIGSKPRDAQSAAVTMAILVDKAQLLTGAATSRPEHSAHAKAQLMNDARDVALRLVG